MSFTSSKNKHGKLKIFDKLKKFNTKRVFMIQMKRHDIRGNHWHKKHNQILLIFAGKIKIHFFNEKKNTKEKEKILTEGELFEMKKNIYIKFVASKKSTIVVLADKDFDKKDYFTI